MANINQDLLDRLSAKLGVGSKAVYSQIAKLVSETHLERPIAALYLARKNGININKYSTEAERAQLRSVPNSGQLATIEAVSVPYTESSSEVPISRKLVKQRTRAGNKQSRSVFVIHGRDSELTESVYAFVRALGIQVLEWNHALKAASKGNANPYIGDILQKVMDKASALVVLLSPDDEARLSEVFVRPAERRDEGTLRGQARPNVLFEAGLALGAFPKKRY